MHVPRFGVLHLLCRSQKNDPWRFDLADEGCGQHGLAQRLHLMCSSIGAVRSVCEFTQLGLPAEHTSIILAESAPYELRFLRRTTYLHRTSIVNERNHLRTSSIIRTPLLHSISSYDYRPRIVRCRCTHYDCLKYVDGMSLYAVNFGRVRIGTLPCQVVSGPEEPRLLNCASFGQAIMRHGTNSIFPVRRPTDFVPTYVDSQLLSPTLELST